MPATSSLRCPVNASSCTNAPNGPPIFSAARQTSDEFVVAQDAITRPLGRWWFHACARRDRNDVARDAPIEQLAHRRERAIGRDRRASVDDPVQYIENIAAGDFPHLAATQPR